MLLFKVTLALKKLQLIHGHFISVVSVDIKVHTGHETR